jgi:hypothetical protein
MVSPERLISHIANRNTAARMKVHNITARKCAAIGGEEYEPPRRYCHSPMRTRVANERLMRKSLTTGLFFTI